MEVIGIKLVMLKFKHIIGMLFSQHSFRVEKLKLFLIRPQHSFHCSGVQLRCFSAHNNLFILLTTFTRGVRTDTQQFKPATCSRLLILKRQSCTPYCSSSILCTCLETILLFFSTYPQWIYPLRAIFFLVFKMELSSLEGHLCGAVSKCDTLCQHCIWLYGQYCMWLHSKSRPLPSEPQ